MFRHTAIVLGLGAVSVVASSPAAAATRHASRPSTTAARAVDRDGPFGIVMGEPLADLGPLEKVAPGQYHVVAPARPNASFNFVTVVGFSDGGVCRIVAVGPSVQFDTKGAAVRSIVDSISETLKQKYGPYTTKQAKCDGDDQICDSLWVSQLNNKQAEYWYGWVFNKENRADGIGALLVEVGSSDSITTFPRIVYDAVDEHACNAKIRAAQGSSL